MTTQCHSDVTGGTAHSLEAAGTAQPDQTRGIDKVSALAELRQHSDVTSLKSALHQLCSEFGRITRLDILTAMHEGTKQAICFLRMERPEQEQQLMKSLGVGRFGGEVVFVLNLNVPAKQEFGPSSQWADSDIY